MSEVADRYRRLSDAFAAKIAAVPPATWESPSPCEGWTARDIVGHVAQTQGMFRSFVGRDVPEGPSVDDDPAGAFDAARGAVQADLDDPELAVTEFDGMMGRTTFETAVGRFLCTDLVVHGWDLARAAGLDDRIDPQDVERVQQVAASFGDAMRSPQAFGPALDPPDGADDQTRLLAFLGRRA
jgi:uncharacterized protein (TIGR03086 family)